jgi:hypothetical protein
MDGSKGILIRQPTILRPDGNPISQPENPIVTERRDVGPTHEQIAEARKLAASHGFRIIKQSANTRRGNIRRARQAEVKRKLKGTGKSIAEHKAEMRNTGAGNQALIKVARQQRREERERIEAEQGS